MEKELERGANKMYGDYVCSKCGKPLMGWVNFVGEVEDDEGHYWRTFCNDCWPGIEHMSDAEIYAQYPEAPYNE